MTLAGGTNMIEWVLRALRLTVNRARLNGREDIRASDIEWAIQELERDVPKPTGAAISQDKRHG